MSGASLHLSYRVLGWTGLTVALDQATKQLAPALSPTPVGFVRELGHAAAATDRPVCAALGLWFDTVRVVNRGVTFGLLESGPAAWAAWVFYVGSALAIAFSLWVLGHTARTSSPARWGAILLLGGVGGNLVDRVRLGHVVDWVGVSGSVAGWCWELPSFNLADVAIGAGLGVLACQWVVLRVPAVRGLVRRASVQDAMLLSGSCRNPK